jgi:hypothetical protein
MTNDQSPITNDQSPMTIHLERSYPIYHHYISTLFIGKKLEEVVRKNNRSSTMGEAFSRLSGHDPQTNKAPGLPCQSV